MAILGADGYGAKTFSVCAVLSTCFFGYSAHAVVDSAFFTEDQCRQSTRIDTVPVHSVNCPAEPDLCPGTNVCEVATYTKQHEEVRTTRSYCSCDTVPADPWLAGSCFAFLEWRSSDGTYVVRCSALIGVCEPGKECKQISASGGDNGKFCDCRK